MGFQVDVLQIYIDDSGSRNPDRAQTNRDDGMDHFALGGIIVNRDKLREIYELYDRFRSKFAVDGPLHSTKIRGKRDQFRWLRQDDRECGDFYTELEALLLTIEAIGIACVIDRPGYIERYREKYGSQRWTMCKTAYCILIERAVKFAQKTNAVLEVFYEAAGKTEDRAILDYARALKTDGMPFDPGTSGQYRCLVASDFQRSILGDPQRRTKSSPLMQIADLYLYPMAKSGYDRSYPPFRKLMERGRIIDVHLTEDEISAGGIKYSCFGAPRES